MVFEVQSQIVREVGYLAFCFQIIVGKFMSELKKMVTNYEEVNEPPS